MHELGVVLGLLDTLEQIAAQQGLQRITAVTLDVGEASGILPDYLLECWKAARLDSPFEKTQLRLNRFPSVGRCVCGTEFALLENSRRCPACGKSDYALVSGRQFDIAQVEGY